MVLRVRLTAAAIELVNRVMKLTANRLIEYSFSGFAAQMPTVAVIAVAKLLQAAILMATLAAGEKAL